mgnify:CR=1 FL=1
MRRCKGVLLAGMLVLSMSVPVYADKSVVVKVEAPADTTDYYMTVDSGGVGVDIYPSTDEKGEKLNDKTVKDGTVLHIEGETEKNGETWGYTEYNGRYGYVPLEELRPSRDAELVKAGIAGSTEKETSGVKQGGASDTQNSSAGETQGEAAGMDNTGNAQVQNGEEPGTSAETDSTGSSQAQNGEGQGTSAGADSTGSSQSQNGEGPGTSAGTDSTGSAQAQNGEVQGHLRRRTVQTAHRLRAVRFRDRLQRREQQKVEIMRKKLSPSRSMAQLLHPLKKRIPGIKVRLSGSGSQQYLQ